MCWTKNVEEWQEEKRKTTDRLMDVVKGDMQRFCAREEDAGNRVRQRPMI